MAIRQDDRQFICDIVVGNEKFLLSFWLFLSPNHFVWLLLPIIVSMSFWVIHTMLSQSLSTSQSTPGDCDWLVVIAVVVLLLKMRWSAFLHMKFSVLPFLFTYCKLLFLYKYKQTTQSIVWTAVLLYHRLKVEARMNNRYRLDLKMICTEVIHKLAFYYKNSVKSICRIVGINGRNTKRIYNRILIRCRSFEIENWIRK